MKVTAEALWGKSQANRWVYIEKQEDRGFQLPRFRESRDFSPNRLSLDQHIDERVRVVVARHKVAMIRLDFPSSTFASGMASLPDENLIELLLHLKVGTHTTSPIPLAPVTLNVGPFR